MCGLNRGNDTVLPEPGNIIRVNNLAMLNPPAPVIFFFQYISINFCNLPHCRITNAMRIELKAEFVAPLCYISHVRIIMQHKAVLAFSVGVVLQETGATRAKGPIGIHLYGSYVQPFIFYRAPPEIVRKI